MLGLRKFQRGKMDKEKINQNIERVYSFIFHTLGCNDDQAKEILKGVLKKIS